MVVPSEKEAFEDSPEDFSNGQTVAILNQDYEGKPTDEEFATLRRVPGKIPTVAYLLCAVEFCERASYYGTLASILVGFNGVTWYGWSIDTYALLRMRSDLDKLHQPTSAQGWQWLWFPCTWKPGYSRRLGPRRANSRKTSLLSRKL